MSNLEEEGLDKLFKQGLNEPGHYAQYRESDWDSLEQMLDRGNKKRGVVFWLRTAGGIAAMLLLAFGWFYLQNNKLPAIKQPVAIHQHKAAQQGPATKNTELAGAGYHATTSQTAGPVNTDNNNAGTNGGSIQQTAAGLKLNQPAVGAAHMLAMERHHRKGNSFFTLSAAAARRGNAGLVVNNVIRGMGNTEMLAAFSGKNIADARLATGDIYAGRPLPLEEQPYKIIDPVYKSFKRRAQLAITVFASPDINGVNTFNNAQVGANLGLQFSVTVSKFTFSTGAAYAKAPYLTPFADYHTTYPFKVDPVNVSADCRVLDVPLNIDYQFYNKAKNQFALGTGLSSYIMLHENYKYNYANPNYYYYPGSYSVTNQNKHFLGVLNLDATYQRRLNSKFSLAVQPYLKIPLTDIGYSRVKLQSAGVAFGVKWNLNSLTKP